MPYSGAVYRAWVAVGLILVASAPAEAGGPVIVGGTPRAIGRAGTSVASDDAGGALLVNPAGLARRDATRFQLGVALVDDAIAWDPDRADAPIARDQAGSRLAPLGAVVGEVRGWILGAGISTAAIRERALRDPSDVPATNVGGAFEYRYTGVAGRLRRDVLTVGVARRIGDAAALGLSIGASRISLGETRRLWAGFAGITDVGDPRRDLQLALAGTDPFVPGATAGVLLAPVDSPMELAMSIAWTARTEIEGDVAAEGTAGGPSVSLDGPRARLAFRHPIAARAGARYLGDRYVVELGGDLWISPRSARQATWHVDGVRVIDPSTVSAPVARVPSRLSQRTHGAIRGALDVELIAGFLWATAGYAFTIGGTSEPRLSPTLADLGGHTVALGIEGNAGGVTYTLGWSRTFAVTRRGGEAFALDNPFAAGDATVALGSYDGSADQLGVLVDIELGPR